MYETWAERKVAAVIQDRHGPNRAGWFGIFQPLADGLKLFMKEEIVPNMSNKFLFVLGPGIAMLTAIMTSAVVNWGGTIHAFGRDINMQIADDKIRIPLHIRRCEHGVYGVG
jgi:NADH-quinone oxidoreductase subunit H